MIKVVALIAARDMRPKDDVKKARDRTRKRIEDAIAKGTLTLTRQGRLTVGEVANWLDAMPDLRGRFLDLPRGAPLEANMTAQASVSARLTFTSLPDNLLESHALIRELRDRIEDLESQLASKDARIAELEPDALRHREVKQQNRANARRERK